MKRLKRNEGHSIFSAVLFLPLIFFIPVVFAGGGDTTFGSVSEIIKQISTYGGHETYQKLMGDGEENLDGSNIIKLNEEITPFNGSVLKTSDWRLSKYKEQSNTFSIKANGHFGYKLRLLDRPELAPYICDWSLESSGRKLWKISKLLLVSEDWSCGTIGCGYEVSFVNRNIPDKKYINFCKGD